MQKNKRNTQSTRPPQNESRKDPARIDYYIQEAMRTINAMQHLAEITSARDFARAMMNASQADREAVSNLLKFVESRAEVIGNNSANANMICSECDEWRMQEELCGPFEFQDTPAGFDDFSKRP